MITKLIKEDYYRNNNREPFKSEKRLKGEAEVIEVWDCSSGYRPGIKIRWKDINTGEISEDILYAGLQIGELDQYKVGDKGKYYYWIASPNMAIGKFIKD